MSGRAIVAYPGRGAVRVVVAVLRFYQRWISPMRPAACRYTPSCSAYAVTALERFGVVRGGWLTLRRLLRCHPYHRGGHDPVPARVPLVGAAASDSDNSSGTAGTTRPHGATATSTPGVPRCHTC